MTRKLTLTAVAVSALCAFGPAMAADEFNVAPGLTYGGTPLGLHGADPVALLDDGMNTEGDASFATSHEGVTFYFASQENLDDFKADPARYVPQYGGFCAFGVSVAKKFDGDPRFAAVVDDKLYVFLNKAVYDMFLEDKPGVIAKATANWTDIQHTAATDL